MLVTMTTTSRLAATIGVGFVLVLVTACSSSSSGEPPATGSATSSPPEAATSVVTSTSRAPADVTAAVTTAMQRWASADTPASACAAVSDPFAMFLGGGSVAQCTTHVVDTVGPLTRGTAHVTRVMLADGQAIATATIDNSVPTPIAFYFVQAGGVWKLNSIGERH